MIDKFNIAVLLLSPPLPGRGPPPKSRLKAADRIVTAPWPIFSKAGIHQQIPDRDGLPTLDERTRRGGPSCSGRYAARCTRQRRPAAHSEPRSPFGTIPCPCRQARPRARIHEYHRRYGVRLAIKCGLPAGAGRFRSQFHLTLRKQSTSLAENAWKEAPFVLISAGSAISPCTIC